MQLTIHLRLIVSSRVASNKSPRWPRSLHSISFICDAFPLCAAHVTARHFCMAFLFTTPSYWNVNLTGPCPPNQYNSKPTADNWKRNYFPTLIRGCLFYGYTSFGWFTAGHLIRPVYEAPNGLAAHSHRLPIDWILSLVILSLKSSFILMFV